MTAPALNIKDRDPQATIATIRSILADIGLYPVESGWHSVSDLVYSCRLEQVELGIGTNGKGVTRALALASAYGEFIERVQNGLLLLPNISLMPERRLHFPDDKIRKLNELGPTARELVNALNCDLRSPERQQFLETRDYVCAQFYDLVGHDFVELPRDTVVVACSSNGMCAGNTPEEALVEGLSEVAERYAMRETYFGKGREFPAIDLGLLPDCEAKTTIEKLKAEDIEVIVKDCTLDGALPVLCTIVIDKDTARYVCAFGASPVLEIALERCLTEACQGISRLCAARTVPISLDDLDAKSSCSDSDAGTRAEYYATIRGNRGRPSPSFLLSMGTPCFQKAFLPRFTTNRAALEHLVGQFKALKARVFVRDVSFLGFPSFSVYVPGFSEIICGGKLCAIPSDQKAKLIRKVFGSLKSCSQPQIHETAVTIDDVLSYTAGPWDYRKDINAFLFRFANINLGSNTDLVQQCTTLHFLQSLLFCRCGDYERAHRHLMDHLELRPEEACSMLACCAAYFRAMADGRPVDSTVSALRTYFEADVVDRVINSVGSPQTALADWALPDCGDCSKCPVREHCSYDFWLPVATHLQEKAARYSPDRWLLRELMD